MVSIITPHWNDYSGIENLLSCFERQVSDAWEWIIIDDASNKEVQDDLKKLQINNQHFNIQLVLNAEKNNASFCRNQGVTLATSETIIFLDSDDTITSDFVKNRQLTVEEFVVFQNIIVINKNSKQPYTNIKTDFLNNFLNAKFAWQTSSILFNKQFFLKIGGFDENMKLLQDVELSIRILLLGNNYQILTDNDVDFFYQVNPIDIKKRTLEKVTDSVNYLVNKSNKQFNLSRNQKRKMTSYYFLAVRYFVKSSESDDTIRLQKCLTTFYRESVISFVLFLIGRLLIKFLTWKILTREQFLRSNRYFFKNE
ncbi:glycosyltransferase family 2 protein [Flavobacterium sp.]|uniref:glycosyltransferase family 2 protein n=1 Tax=Flavobacterium sp. TaxID=239 RepID=UPI003526D2F7